MDILNLIIIAILVFLFPLGQIFRIDLGNGIAINPLDIGIFIFALISLMIALKKKVGFVYIKLIGLFGIVGLLGLLVNIRYLNTSELIISFLYLLRFECYGLIVLGIRLISKKEWIWKSLFLGGGIVVVAGFIQYFFYKSLYGVLYEGWDPHLYRMFSTFLDPNFSGPFFVLYFLLILHKWFEGKSKRWLGLLGFLTFLAVILSFSRGAYIDLIVSVVVYLFLRGYKKIALGIPILVVLMSLFIAFFLPYGEEKNLFRTASTQARLLSAENSLQIFIKNPILGVGFNSYRYAQHRYNLLNGFNWEDTHSGAGSNNSYVFVLATTGIIGGIIFGWFWFKVLKNSLKNLKKQKSYGLFFFTSFIALLVSGIFENTLFYPSIMLWMFVLLGLIG